VEYDNIIHYKIPVPEDTNPDHQFLPAADKVFTAYPLCVK
jgi:hypothetical protein